MSLGKLSPEDINQLVVHDKWLAALSQNVQSELGSYQPGGRRPVKQLAERYATPVPQPVTQVASLSAKSDEHLKRMGFAR